MDEEQEICGLESPAQSHKEDENGHRHWSTEERRRRKEGGKGKVEGKRPEVETIKIRTSWEENEAKPQDEENLRHEETQGYIFFQNTPPLVGNMENMAEGAKVEKWNMRKK